MPRLYVVATPIGNLEDITLRALRVLREVPLIAAEDTRRTRTLLAHYNIATPTRSYHQHNKTDSLPKLLDHLQTADLALVSDAGMPSVADPGFELIQAAHRAGIGVDVIPGPSAVITAVVGAAIPARGYVFLGFLGRKSGERRRQLSALASADHALVLFEAPHRLIATLGDLLVELGNRQAVVAREMTKVHQEYAHGSLSELIERFTATLPRGECTVVVAPFQPAESDGDLEAAHRAMVEEFAHGTEAKNAVRIAVERFGVPRNAAYRMWLEVASHTSE